MIDPCGGNAKRGGGCRCDPPFTSTERRTVRRLVGHLIAECALTLLDTVVYAAAGVYRRRQARR